MTSTMKPDEVASFARLGELELNPLPGKFDAAHLRAIHGHIFQDSPEHRPGQYREGSETWIKQRALEAEGRRYHVHYGPSSEIPGRVSAVLEAAGGVDGFKGLGKQEFSEKMAALYADLDRTHPFMEGNSRTLREFTRELAQAAGYKLDWSPTAADAESRDRLYIARDLAVTERAFPGLDANRAATTESRAEYEAFMHFTRHYAGAERLETLIAGGLEPMTQADAYRMGDVGRADVQTARFIRGREAASKQLAQSDLNDGERAQALDGFDVKALDALGKERGVDQAAATDKKKDTQPAKPAASDELDR